MQILLTILLLWIAPAVVLGAYLLWISFREPPSAWHGKQESGGHSAEVSTLVAAE
jgi:hypothetical protein